MNPRVFLCAAALAGAPAVASASDPEPYTAADEPRFVNAVGPQQPSDNAQWWQRFRDPKLNGLVDEGLEGSFDVQAAKTRVEEADAVVVQQLSPLMPTASWDTDLTIAPTDSLGFGFGVQVGGMGPEPPPVYYRFSSAVNAAVEIDVTGRQILQHKAAKNDVRASEDDVDVQRQVLTASIVRAYYDLVATRAQLEIVAQQVEANEQLLELTELRFEAGQATAVDVLQQRQQLASAKTRVPLAVQQEQTAQQRLAVLLGEPPGRTIDTPTELPKLPPQPSVGTPGDLVDARPDLRALKRRFDSSSIRKKSARRQFAPSLFLTGAVGVQGIRIDEWNTQGFWNAGVLLSVPLSTGGGTYGRLKQADAQERTTAHQLSSATVTAIGEVEAALVAEKQRAEALELYKEQAEAAYAAFEESTARYSAGLAEYLTVLAALNAAQAAQIEVLLAQRDLLSARIDLHQALGDQ